MAFYLWTCAVRQPPLTERRETVKLHLKAKKRGTSPMAEEERITNRLLQALPAATLARLRPALELVTTEKNQVIDRIDAPITDMFFVNRGLVSLVKTMDDGRTLEIGAVGTEGVTDPNTVFRPTRAAVESIVQIPGTAFRIKGDTLRQEVGQDGALRDLMARYARFRFIQLAQNVACNRLHSIPERCCRWLLIGHDSALSDTFSLTHEFLAMMLGVRRPGVSAVANELKQAGLIDYKHGMMTITDRAGLEATACECYRAIQNELQELLSVSEASEAVEAGPVHVLRN